MATIKKKQPFIKAQGKRPARRTPTAVKRAKLRRAAQAGLSLKRQRTAAAYVGSAKGNKAAAMRTAGYEETTATHKQGEVFGDKRVQREIRRLLADKGLTDEHAAERLYEATNALEPKFFQDTVVADVVAHDVRLEAVRVFFQLTGRLTNKVEIEVVVRQFTEQIVLVIEKYVPAEQRAAALDEIIASLQSAGRN